VTDHDLFASDHGAVNAMDGNVRVGLEAIEDLSLRVATSDEAREILHLKGGDKLEV
jgi:uncharacterized protein (DUF849 family)